MLSDGSIASVLVQIRPYRPAADSPWVEELWAAAMPPAWPVLRTGIAALTGGLVAESSAGPVGFAAVDPAGSIPLILVQPRTQRRGVGTRLLAEAADVLRASHVSLVHAASGGSSYIWPGVPRDLPGAVAFFTARGWQHSHDVVDMIADLGSYQPPALTPEHSARGRISLTRASPADTDAVLAFEKANFPSWVRWFQPTGEHVLTARDASADIAGTLLFDGPGADTVFASMLGPAVGTIGCVGVTPRLHGHGIGTALVVHASQLLSLAGTRACHIGWTTRESFYRKCGFRPWRRYAMFSRDI
ncbi:MAG TPA: GNAT family N-acetyltransferase [Streptosporangiaceae bacterium]